MRTTLLAISAFVLSISAAHAGPVTYDVVGHADVTGFVTFNLPVGPTGVSFVSNSTVTALSMVVGGEIFSLADVVTGDGTIFDFGLNPPAIVNGAGSLANNGSELLTLFTGSDGDAIILMNSRLYEVQWVARDGAVPEPATLTLLAAALPLFALLRRKRSA